MRTVHRVIAVFAVLFGLYIATTGLTVQSMDLSALLSHAPASDPTMQAIRVGINGPPNFQVIRDPDYAAPSLPADFNFDTALGVVTTSARAAVGDAPISFLELRMVDGKPVGQAMSKGRQYRFDAATGAQVGAPTTFVLDPLSRPSLRNTVKDFHRMRAFGEYAMIVDILAGATICVMIFTGVVMYFRLLSARVRMERNNPFWVAGGWWRTFHRGIAIVAATFLTVIAVTGMILGTSSIGVFVNRALAHGKRPALTADVSSPLSNTELPGMLHTTLAAYRAIQPGGPVKVLRLRYFAGMPQGVVVAGGETTRQLAFNAVTGRTASFTEPGYPPPGQTFGWQVDETVKQIHRGDAFGLSGRWMSVFGGLSLLYLSISGIVMYLELWRKRRQRGKHGLFWS